jgi:hypothetical protein
VGLNRRIAEPANPCSPGGQDKSRTRVTRYMMVAIISTSSLSCHTERIPLKLVEDLPGPHLPPMSHNRHATFAIGALLQMHLPRQRNGW